MVQTHLLAIVQIYYSIVEKIVVKTNTSSYTQYFWWKIERIPNPTELKNFWMWNALSQSKGPLRWGTVCFIKKFCSQMVNEWNSEYKQICIYQVLHTHSWSAVLSLLILHKTTIMLHKDHYYSRLARVYYKI